MNPCLEISISGEDCSDIEIIIDTWEIPQGGDFLFGSTGALFGKPTRTWDEWLEEMAAKQQ